MVASTSVLNRTGSLRLDRNVRGTGTLHLCWLRMTTQAMDDTYAVACTHLESQLRSSFVGRRYSGKTLFTRLQQCVSAKGVRLFPLATRRIINIGNSGKWFVLQYAGEVRPCRNAIVQICSSF